VNGEIYQLLKTQKGAVFYSSAVFHEENEELFVLLDAEMIRVCDIVWILRRGYLPKGWFVDYVNDDRRDYSVNNLCVRPNL